MRKQNDLFESVLDEAANVANERLGTSIEMPTDEICFSKKHEAKMKKLIRKQNLKEKFFENLTTNKKIACILLACFVFTGVTMFGVNAWRMITLNYVFDPDKPNTDISFGVNKGSFYSDDSVLFRYIPMGFEITKNSSRSAYLKLKFSRDEQYFVLSVNGLDGNLSVDTENAKIEKIFINGNEGIYSTNEDVNILFWHNETNAFTISGNISKEEMIKIAQNFELLG